MSKDELVKIPMDHIAKAIKKAKEEARKAFIISLYQDGYTDSEIIILLRTFTDIRTAKSFVNRSIEEFESIKEETK